MNTDNISENPEIKTDDKAAVTKNTVDPEIKVETSISPDISDSVHSSHENIVETLGKDKTEFPDKGGAHDTEDNNRASRGLPPVEEKESKNSMDAEQKEDKNKLSVTFDDLSNAAQQRALEFSTLPAAQQKELLHTFQETAYQPPDLPVKGIDRYKTVPQGKHMDDDDLIKFTLENWGDWLAADKRNSLKIDAITRTELRDYDKNLMKRLETRFSPEKLNTIIQSDTFKTEIDIKNTPEKEIEKAFRMVRHIQNQVITAEVA